MQATVFSVQTVSSYLRSSVDAKSSVSHSDSEEYRRKEVDAWSFWPPYNYINQYVEWYVTSFSHCHLFPSVSSDCARVVNSVCVSLRTCVLCDWTSLSLFSTSRA